MWLSWFEGKDTYFLPFEINSTAESVLTFWTYIIILQVSETENLGQFNIKILI